MRHEVIAGKLLEKRKKATCSRCPSDSVDVDLGETGGVVVDDDLDRWNIQAPVEEQQRGQNHCDLSPLRQIFMQRLGFLPGCHVCCYQNFVDAGLELGKVCKTLFLEKIKRSRSFCRAIHLV